MDIMISPTAFLSARVRTSVLEAIVKATAAPVRKALPEVIPHWPPPRSDGRSAVSCFVDSQGGTYPVRRPKAGSTIEMKRFSKGLSDIETGSALLRLYKRERWDEARSLILRKSEEARKGDKDVAKELQHLLLYLGEYVRAHLSESSPTAAFVKFVLGFPPRMEESEDVLFKILGPRRPHGATPSFRNAAALGLFQLTSGRDGPPLIGVQMYWGYVVEIYLTDSPFELPPIRADLFDDTRYREHLDWALRRAESRKPKRHSRRNVLRAAALGSVWDAVQPDDSVPAEIRRPFFERTLRLTRERPDLVLPVIARNGSTLIHKGIATFEEIVNLLLSRISLWRSQEMKAGLAALYCETLAKLAEEAKTECQPLPQDLIDLIDILKGSRRAVPNSTLDWIVKLFLTVNTRRPDIIRRLLS